MKRPGDTVDDTDVETAVPLVYTLLPSKSQVHYTEVLQAVKDAATMFRARGNGPGKCVRIHQIAIWTLDLPILQKVSNF